MRRIRKEATNRESRSRVTKALEERIVTQRRAIKCKENTTEGIRMASRRWLRSDVEGGNRVRGDREEKGKGIMEEATEKEILTVQDDSEEDVEMFDSDGEEEGLGRE